MLKKRITSTTLGCGTCVREYYRILSEKRAELEAAYGTELVDEFFLRVDIFNNDRISNRLSHCANQLERLPESQRKLKNLDTESLFAFLEAMASPVYSQNESLLARYFDMPFKLLNGIKKLKPDSYLPAMTSFLFSNNPSRVEWAEYNWSRFERAPTRREFDGAVREPLVSAMARVHVSNLDREFLPGFWKGMRIIAAHLNADLITHSLRGLGGSNVFMLSLEHLHQNLDSETFLAILATINEFLRKAPKAYWDSMGTINPQTVVEQILVNPNLPKLLREDQLELLATALEFVEPFLQSLNPDKQPNACRSIAQHLIAKYRDRALASEIRKTCFSAAMSGIRQSLEILIRSTRIWGEVDPACIGELLDVFNDYASEIADATKFLTNQTSVDTPPGLLVVQKVVELDVALLSMAHHGIISKKPLMPHHFFKSGQIWKSLLRTVKAGRAQAVATRMLLGSRGLSMNEKFIATKHQALTKDMITFNNAFDSTMNQVNDVLEAINDWQPRDINSIFKSAELASGFVATLFFADKSVRITAVEILKTMSNEDDRRDAIRQVLSSTYLSAVTAFSQVIRSVERGKQYGPHSAAIRILSDVLDSLCNSQDGLLRSKDLDAAECDATLSLWETLWELLTRIFESTEQWSKQGHPKAEMHEFCRDVMQFAESLYGYHAVMVSSMSEEDADSEAKAKTTHDLLQYPNETMSAMVGWLRLADEFLISKIVTVFNTLLGNLRAAKLTVAKEVLSFVEQIINNQVKAKLSASQRGSLMQSLESHGGIKAERAISIKQEKGAKQGSLKNWLGPADGEDKTTFQDRMAKVVRDNSQASARFNDLKSQFSKPVVPKVVPAKTVDQEFLRQRLADREADQKRRAAAAEERKKKLALLQAAEKKEKGIMVSSDESEDSSDDDEEEDMDKILFGIKKVSKPRADKSNLKIIATKDLPKGPVKVKKLLRTAKDARARLAPSLSMLHSNILAWDYFHDGDVPPGSEPSMYQAVQSKYPNPLEYKRIFEPLLSLEAWQGFVKAREEGIFKPFRIKVANRSNVDSFVEISTVMPATNNREVSEGDVVLLSLSENPTQNKNVPHCLARVHKVSYKKKRELEIVYRAVTRGPMVKDIRPELELWGVKIQSLTPLEREYGVLQSLQYYDLCDYILAGKPSALLEYSDSVLSKFMHNYNLNKAQSKAVHSALDNDAFTLIQGPPGSGKTKTIVAIVGALLSDALTRGQGIGVDSSKKLLVCAPSNAAVDELVMRFKQGVKTVSGKEFKVKVVRIGRGDAVNASVQDVTMEKLLEARLNLKTSGQTPGQENQGAELGNLMTQHKEVSEKLKVAREKLDEDDSAPQKENFNNLKRQKMELGARIDSMKDAAKTTQRNNEMERRRAQKAIVDEAHIICATLSGSGHDMFQSLGVDFETVVVDEAAQCVEASALIPLKYGCTKCILVGDPKQLPPTVLSKEASRFSYEKSMFVRMQENYPKDVHLLDTQYRMHTQISRFPSSAFYDGKLLDGPGMDELRKQPWHCAPLLGPYRFFDVQGQHQVGKFHSLINTAEVDIAIRLYDRLTTDFADMIDFKGKIGIITPYKSQLQELKTQFSRRYGQDITNVVEFNTTDAFQGREAEVIIFSCVRASPSGGVGFLQDIRRMNVGLTRAKSSLWVLGNSDSLVRGEYWRKLINDAKDRGLFLKGGYYQELQRPTSSSSKAQWVAKNPIVSSRPNVPLSAAVKTDKVSRSVESGTAAHGPQNGLPSRPPAQKEHNRATSSTTKSKPSNSMSQPSSMVRPMKVEVKDVDMLDAPDANAVEQTPHPHASTGSSTSKTTGVTGLGDPDNRPDRPNRPPVNALQRRKRPPANPLLNRPKKPRPP
jgi:senataxin